MSLTSPSHVSSSAGSASEAAADRKELTYQSPAIALAPLFDLHSKRLVRLTQKAWLFSLSLVDVLQTSLTTCA